MFIFFKPAYLVVYTLNGNQKQPVGCIKLGKKKKNPFFFHFNPQNPNPPFLFSLESQPFFVTISRLKISTIFCCFQFHFYSITSTWSFYKRPCLFFIEEYVFINDFKLSLHTHFLSKLRVWFFLFFPFFVFWVNVIIDMGSSLNQWESDPLFSAAEVVQDSADRSVLFSVFVFGSVFIAFESKKFPFWEVLCGFNENLRFMWQMGVMLST